MTYACRDCDTTFTAPTDTETVRCPGCGDMVERQPAVSSPPPDQTLRDRIADAVQDGPTWMLPRSLAEEVADAVLAVLPPPADRAAVLREAADRYAQLVDENEAYDREHGQLDETARVQHGAVRDVVVGLRRLAAEAPQQESGSGCAHCVCCHTWGDREAHAALVRDDGADARQPETCRNCQGSGLDPRYNGEYACPDCSAEAPQPEEEAELVCVDECGFCDACGMEPVGTPAEGWREAARFLRRTSRDSTDFSGALRGARLIEDELRRRAEAQQPDTETRTSWTPGPVALARAVEWATKRQDATVDPAMCPRCKADNSEAFELCTRCATTPAVPVQPAADGSGEETDRG